MTLELTLETAYANVLRANEPALAEVSIRLTHAVLEQAPPIEPSEGAPGKLELPSITLSAKKGREMIYGSGIFEVEMSVAYEDVAQREGSDGRRTDELFQAATRPFIYANGSLMFTQAVSGFLCYGIRGRGAGSPPQLVNNTVTMQETALFVCTIPS